MIEAGRVTTMEKLELLSRTALLKQGIDRTENNASEKTYVVDLADSNNRLMTGGPIMSQSQHLLSVRDGAATAAIPSPVSTDVENEDDAGVIASSKMSRNLHSTKARIIESRSPITTVECGQYVAAPSPSPFPTSPQSYGFALHPGHNHILHQSHSQDQQEYPPSQYNNHNGNIIRTLSEASFAPIYGNSLNHNVSASASAPNNSESDAAFHPPQREAQPPRLQLQQRRQPSSSREDMARQIMELREQLSEKDMVVSSLQHRVNYLENQIHELRQLPTGKVSHIPVDDMIRIMQDYGSEVSNQTLPQQRKQTVKKASIVRQFRRWNPEFFRFFLHHNGEWVPKLGREGELRRRAGKRRLLLIAKQSAGIKDSDTK